MRVIFLKKLINPPFFANNKINETAYFTALLYEQSAAMCNLRYDIFITPRDVISSLVEKWLSLVKLSTKIRSRFVINS